MKSLGCVLALAFLATAWQSVPLGQSSAGESIGVAGIDGGGAPRSDCVQAGDDRMSGCRDDELRRAVMAGINAGGAPRSDCLQAEDDWMSGCRNDELKRIVVAGIDAGGRP